MRTHPLFMSDAPSDRLRIVLLMLVLALASIIMDASAAAQNRNAVETMNFDQVMEVDELGLATITIKMSFTAAQFQEWQSKYGSNKSLLRRDMNKFLSQYDTFDWDVSEKQMDREITVRLKARGAVLHKGRGVTEFSVPKEWRGGERRENTFTFNYVEGIAPGVVGQFNVRLVAPASASNFREQVGESGEKVIQYTLPTSAGSNWMLIAGLVICVLGAGLVGASLIGGPVATPKVSKAGGSSSSSSSRASDARHAPARQPGKPSPKSIDPPSMSTIPLEETNTGTFVPERKDSSASKRT